MSSRESTADEIPSGSYLRAVSRRTFLAVSGLVGAAGITEGANSDVVESASIRELPLRIEDLTEPESYVEWSIDATTAPLPAHLDGALDGFVPDEGAMTGFVATEAASGPRAVESAVYPAGGLRTVATATNAWVRRDHGGTNARTVRHEPGRGVVQWETTSEDGVDALRLERFPGNRIAFVGASGTTTGLDPRSAVSRYADTMRARAEGATIESATNG